MIEGYPLLKRHFEGKNINIKEVAELLNLKVTEIDNILAEDKEEDFKASDIVKIAQAYRIKGEEVNHLFFGHLTNTKAKA